MTLLEVLENGLRPVIGLDASSKVAPRLAREVYSWLQTPEGRHAFRTMQWDAAVEKEASQ